ncbi:polysaccharide deacetylase family protein [Candidatus Micrarchaeota archaeon]|nr:polysaccharide deacetylase family protein [Candidatus Micrarchaeota archaeon]
MREVYFLILGILLISLIYAYFKPEQYERGIVSLSFDDGVLTQYENAFPLMQKYNYTGTVYYAINTTRFYELEPRKLMSVENLIEMHGVGWEIGAHTVNHVNLKNADDEQLEYELTYPIEFFKEEGITVKTISFPYGAYDERVIENIKKYYAASRTSMWGFNDRGTDKYHLKTKVIQIDSSPEEICRWIKQAEQNKEWVILMFHSVENEKTKKYDISVHEFEQILRCINQSDIKVMNVKDVVN